LVGCHTGRWEQVARVMRSDDAVYAARVVAMARTCASEAFYAFDDPLEAALFSVLICMYRENITDVLRIVPGDFPSFPEVPSCGLTGKFPHLYGNGRV